MLGLLKNEDIVSELLEVIATYEKLSEVTVTKESSPLVKKEPTENIAEQPLVMRDVKQVTKRPRMSQEIRINA